MIKELIKDIAYENITLGQGLTRAKLIASKVKNESFRQWLNKELEGYIFDDEILPAYRKMRCVIYFRVEFPFGRWQTFPYVLSEEAKRQDPKFANMIEYHRALEPISIIEKNLSSLTTQKGEIQLTPEITDLIGEQYHEQVADHGGLIRSSYKEIARAQLEAIIELTKQKLIDTLLSLDEEFPDLTNEFTMTKDNIDKVQNIITTNIYGNNNPLNVAAGANVEQGHISTTFTIDHHRELEKLGVDKNDIENLKAIVETKGEDKSSLKSKTMKWLGNVSATVAAKGLSENLPAIIDFVEKLF